MGLLKVGIFSVGYLLYIVLQIKYNQTCFVVVIIFNALHCICFINIDYFMVGERVRFLFTSCEESQTNE